ncbi:MAG: amidase family protein, partial [Bacteroidota bacterium]
MRAFFLSCLLLVSGLYLFGQSASPAQTKAAASLIGLEFDSLERAYMQANLSRQRGAYESLREQRLENSIMPAVMFNPVLPGTRMPALAKEKPIDWNLPKKVKRPKQDGDLAFLSVPELASLIKRKKITSVELTQVYLNRIKRFADSLHCVVTLTEEVALAQARKADAALAAGTYLGPLHGIPYGVKDLLAVPGYPTTWGAAPFKDQTFSEQATVVSRLEEAGAVLLGKLSMGALAMGDVWFKDRTRNPWNLDQGSSGSSAGSASATAAGLVGFSIGTETMEPQVSVPMEN